MALCAIQLVAFHDEGQVHGLQVHAHPGEVVVEVLVIAQRSDLGRIEEGDFGFWPVRVRGSFNYDLAGRAWLDVIDCPDEHRSCLKGELSCTGVQY